MLDLVDVTLRIGGRPLLEGASLHLAAGTRMALVGRNGSGKSSLLKLVTGELHPDAGSIRLQAGARIGTVAQDAPGGAISPLEAVLAADRERTALLAERLRADPVRAAEIEERLRAIGADSAPARAARILRGLGFDEAAQTRPLTSFSGGWRMRVALAAVLFLEPDLLLLDEPTNHLDLEAALWLEDHLRRYPRTLLLVSHDRDFLNAVAQKVCHLESGKLTVYTGDYDAFERQRREKLALQQKARARQEAERARIKAFVDRFRYKASKARQAQSRLKILERMEPIARAMAEPEVHFSLPCGKLPAPPLLTMENVRVGYGATVVLDRLSLRIDPDDRIALLGANGNGKSTFAKLLAGRLAPTAGTLTAARGLVVGYFAQHQIEELDPNATALEHLTRLRPRASEQELRELLARFGLVQERATTVSKHLSGGERTRLCLCLVCLQPPNLLILDEPTNHLDIDSREALVEALNAFEGAVVLISHDRHLVEATADVLWLVADGRVRPFDGDVEDYRRLLLETSASDGSARPPSRAGPGKSNAAERRARIAPLRQRARAAERELEELGARRAAIERELADPAVYRDGAAVAARRRTLAELAERIAAAEARWLEAEAEIEAIEARSPAARETERGAEARAPNARG
ncbi:MAG: ATP-binding cassette domain-containing protein [Geminicoccaceae bacterium]|nr:ATP-binding cassette domain-containing protein [Geminicoccaceae bacterium]